MATAWRPSGARIRRLPSPCGVRIDIPKSFVSSLVLNTRCSDPAIAAGVATPAVAAARGRGRGGRGRAAATRCGGAARGTSSGSTTAAGPPPAGAGADASAGVAVGSGATAACGTSASVAGAGDAASRCGVHFSCDSAAEDAATATPATMTASGSVMPRRVVFMPNLRFRDPPAKPADSARSESISAPVRPKLSEKSTPPAGVAQIAWTRGIVRLTALRFLRSYASRRYAS